LGLCLEPASVVPPGKNFARYPPLRSVTRDLETGTLTALRGPEQLATCNDFPNIDLGGFVGVDTGNKFCGGSTRDNQPRPHEAASCSLLLSSASASSAVPARSAWASTRLHPEVASPDDIALFTRRACPAPRPARPSSAASSYHPGHVQPGINLAEGSIVPGTIDLDATGVLAAFPFLSCVQSCARTARTASAWST
jgi:hypothetical protein